MPPQPGGAVELSREVPAREAVGAVGGAAPPKTNVVRILRLVNRAWLARAGAASARGLDADGASH